MESVSSEVVVGTPPGVIPGVDAMPDPEDAVGKVTVSLDRTRAYISVTMPRHGGLDLTADQIYDLLRGAGVTFGIRDFTVDSLEDRPLYSRDVLVAEGTSPTKGRDGELTYHIKLTRDTLPQERPDGTLDYRTLGLIENVAQDQLLCTKTLAEDGVDGMNVLGEVVAAQRGKDVSLPLGKNTYISEDQLALHAKIAGQCDMRDRKLAVDDTYIINGDVSMATGNIKFVGNVNINGGVNATFIVEAEGNIKISGVVDSATVIAGGDIIIAGGFNGGQKGELTAGGSVRAKYIQGGRVTAAGLVETQVIMQSTVQTGDSVVLKGQKTTIMGGRVTAKTKVECDFLGHRDNQMPTIIEVGSDPSLSARKLAISREVAALQKQLESIAQIVKSFEEFDARQGLPPERKAVLLRSRHSLRTGNEQLLALNQENDEIRMKLATEGYGTIIARQSAFPGVHVIIGPEHHVVSQPVQNVMIVRGEEGLYTSAPTAKK